MWIAKEKQGEGEIRTPGTLITFCGFQDRCIQPLCHLSAHRESSIRGGFRTIVQRFGSELSDPFRIHTPRADRWGALERDIKEVLSVGHRAARSPQPNDP